MPISPHDQWLARARATSSRTRASPARTLSTASARHFSPVEAGRRADEIAMSAGLAVIVLAAWAAALLALGAWRTRRVDA
jgi:hypothetical protein